MGEKTNQCQNTLNLISSISDHIFQSNSVAFRNLAVIFDLQNRIYTHCKIKQRVNRKQSFRFDKKGAEHSAQNRMNIQETRSTYSLILSYYNLVQTQIMTNPDTHTHTHEIEQERKREKEKSEHAFA